MLRTNLIRSPRPAVFLFAAALIVLTALVMAAPADAAQPFGSFGGIEGGGNAGAGVIGLHGWALDDDGVASVDIVVDGLVAGRAHYGRSRPGVAQQYPTFPNSDAAGYVFALDTTQYLNGLHRVWARVTSLSGEVRDLPARDLEFLNLTHNLVPFGSIDFPNRQVDLLGTCGQPDPELRRLHVIWGHALDVGVEIGDQGVAYVELLIDGAFYKHSLLSCHYTEREGGLTDCYGLRRLDITRVHPTLSDSPTSGFRFVIDVGELISSGLYNPGRHTLSIRAGDISGQVATIDEIPVFFSCDTFTGNETAFGEIRRPRNGLIYSGTVPLWGWALDFQGVSEVAIWIDGERFGTALYGLERPWVSMLYPTYPDSAFPGWDFFLDTTQLSDGEHYMQVFVRDDRGQSTLIGERRFVVLNNP